MIEIIEIMGTLIPLLYLQGCLDDSDDTEGCMDQTANNYNPNATVHDGSCTYGCTIM
jgi:hypothetical protein